MLLRVIIPIVLLLSSAAPVIAQGEPRIRIAIVRYGGATAGSPAESGFDAFGSLVRIRINGIRDRVLEGASIGADLPPDLAYIDDLAIEIVESDADSTPVQVRDWIVEKQLLEVFQGAILPGGSGEFDILTNCYFVGDPAAPRIEVFELRLGLPDGFADFRDSHSLVLIYAIAQEAIRIGAERDKIAAIVANGIDLLADIERRGAASPQEIAKLKTAWRALEDAF